MNSTSTPEPRDLEHFGNRRIAKGTYYGEIEFLVN